MKLSKGLLSVGTHKSPDGDIVVTPQRIKHWADQHKAMIDAGIGSPVSYDHADNAAGMMPLPMSTLKSAKKRSAANSVGWIDSLKPAADGNSAEFVLDIPDDKAATQAKKNVVEFSPVILEEYTDGSGKVWKDVITHGDLVNHPVDHNQTPFKVVGENAIACAIRMSLGGKVNVYRMSEDAPEGDEKPADDSKSPTDENPDMPKGPQSDDDKKFDAIKAYLAEMGLVMPSDTDQSNFQERILTSLMTWKAAKEKAEADAAADKETDEDDDMPLDEKSPQFAAMSLKVQQLEASDKQHRTEKQTARRMALKTQIDALLQTGRCLPAEATAIATPLDALKMSLDDGENKSLEKAELWVESRSALPKGAVWDSEMRTKRMALEEKEPGRELTGGEMSDEEADALVDGIFKRQQRKPRETAEV